jgi:hypothetical protein
MVLLLPPMASGQGRDFGDAVPHPDRGGVVVHPAMPHHRQRPTGQRDRRLMYSNAKAGRGKPPSDTRGERCHKIGVSDHERRDQKLRQA